MTTTFTMNDGLTIPGIGFGTWKMPAEETVRSVQSAITTGYRLIDTASLYGNEAEVGEAVRTHSDVAREDIFVTTKIWNDRQGYDESRRAFEEGEAKMDIGPIDLLLIHWPVPGQDAYVDTWRTFIELRDEGRVRSIGVSNFLEEHIERLIAETGVAPAVNQVELHPYLPQRQLREFHAEHGIVTEAWSPIHQGTKLLLDPRVTNLADAAGVTSAQAVLAWHISKGIVPLPKSVNEDRIAENLRAADITLPAEVIEGLDALETGVRRGAHPNEMGGDYKATPAKP